MGSNASVKLGCVSTPIDNGESYYTRSKTKCKNNNNNTNNFQHEVSYSSLSPPAPSLYLSDSNSHSHSHSLSHSSSDSDYSSYTKMNVKLLFLDVDGVLNNKYLKWDEYNNGIDDKLLKYLKLIILKTGCKIVLSTTWRLNSKAKRILLHSIKTRCDLNTDDIIIGQTCDARYLGKNRSYEIAHYLKTNQNKFNIISWCAIDDLSLNKQKNSYFMNGHFVKTDQKIGISPQNALSCIDILNCNDHQFHPYKPFPYSIHY